MTSKKRVWLDADFGHDDAIALYMPQIELVGVSTVHGNASVDNTTNNVARLLHAFASNERAATLELAKGSSQPLLRPAKPCPEIHGSDGLGGVEGLPPPTEQTVAEFVKRAQRTNAVAGLTAATSHAIQTGTKMTIIATGSLTNVALFVAAFPDLVCKGVEQIVLMGGAEGRGNMSPTAEFNIMCDPEAAQMVFDAECPIVMIPLNVTHTNLFTQAQSRQLLRRTAGSPHWSGAATSLRHTLYTLLNFFAATYASTFGFETGPPVHDPLCVFYVCHPEYFTGRRYRVDVELAGTHTAGTTVIDLYDMRGIDPEGALGWGRQGKNVWVADSADIDQFWHQFHECVNKADKISPLNKP
ncbi:hypothetical protein ACM66B_001002 [Microbotryomycetes sp. NB124-2]